MSSHRRGSGTPEYRTQERLWAHWEIERELADRLRSASREERTTLYGTVYDELFRRVPDHPQVVRRADPAQRNASGRQEAALVRRFLPAGGIFLEIGAGDCALSLAISPDAARVYAVEVSSEIAQRDDTPGNFQLLITDGREIPIEPGSVDLAYSNQLMEHLHPDDAQEQLEQVFTSLRSGGRYVCFTPNRLLGPGDISKYFEDEVARGFHLREYDNRELRDLFQTAGFASVQIIAKLRKRTRLLPIAPFLASEVLFEAVPPAARRRLKHSKLIHKLISPGGGVIATKA